MTAAVQNRMVKTALECFIEFAQNASRILKFLSPFFHLFARTMGNVLRFIDDLICCFLCTVGHIVDCVFRFVLQVAHAFSPSAICSDAKREAGHKGSEAVSQVHTAPSSC